MVMTSQQVHYDITIAPSWQKTVRWQGSRDVDMGRRHQMRLTQSAKNCKTGDKWRKILKITKALHKTKVIFLGWRTVLIRYVFNKRIRVEIDYWETKYNNNKQVKNSPRESPIHSFWNNMQNCFTSHKRAARTHATRPRHTPNLYLEGAGWYGGRYVRGENGEEKRALMFVMQG